MRILFCVLVLLLFCRIRSNADSVNFRVAGEIKSGIILSNGSFYTNYAFPFDVQVGKGGWSVKTIFGEDYYLATGGDHTNNYNLLEDPKARKTELSAMPGWITGGDYPLNGEWYTTMPWLAFCSGVYLNGSNATIPAVWANTRIDPTTGIYRIIIVKTNAPPGLPMYIKFQVVNSLKTNMWTLGRLDKAYLNDTTQASLDFYTNGFVGGIYTVRSWTNYGGSSIPLEFEIDRYSPDPRQPVLTYVGKVYRLSAATNVSFLPEVKGSIYLTDFRFRNTEAGVDYITYGITNGGWKLTSSSNLQAMFQRKLSIAAKLGLPTAISSARAEWYRRITLVLMIIVTLLPLYLWWRIKEKRKQNKPKVENENI